MTILAFDIGTKRTGVAVAFEGTGLAVARDTIVHQSNAQLLNAVMTSIKDVEAKTIVLGLPLLPSGEEGAQARFVRLFEATLKHTTPSLQIHVIDERYTTPRNAQYDGNSAAACALLQTYIERMAGN